MKIKKLLIYLSIFLSISLPLSLIASSSNSDVQIKFPYNNQYYRYATSNQNSGYVNKMLNGFVNGGPLMKLCRGFANVIFGPFEILIEPYEVNQKDSGVVAATYGLGKGIVYFLAREVVGIVDIFTFPFPLPGASEKIGEKYGYGPLMKPAWVFSLDRNPFDFIYNE